MLTGVEKKRHGYSVVSYQEVLGSFQQLNLSEALKIEASVNHFISYLLRL